MRNIARSRWTQVVSLAAVGVLALSFSGISQLFVAGARPPHLAAVLPLSVISDIYRHPGLPPAGDDRR